MIDDYFIYLVELLHVNDRARELMSNITQDVAPEYPDTDYETFSANVCASSDMDVSEVAPTTAAAADDDSPEPAGHTSSNPHFADVVPTGSDPRKYLDIRSP